MHRPGKLRVLWLPPLRISAERRVGRPDAKNGAVGGTGGCVRGGISERAPDLDVARGAAMDVGSSGACEMRIRFSEPCSEIPNSLPAAKSTFSSSQPITVDPRPLISTLHTKFQLPQPLRMHLQCG